MKSLTRRLVVTWTGLGPRFLPFADAATPDLPLSRLLRLSLFQASVGMALVLLVGTLNRVMIVELGVPASLVAIMISLPVMFAPFRALIGFRSDTHRSELGWRRVPFIWMGTMLQFGGLAIMPFALLLLTGKGELGLAWLGHLGAGFAFLLVGAGLQTTQTAGLALATDLTTDESKPKVVGLMYVMLLVGTIVSAVVFGQLLAEFSPGRLVQVIQGAGLATMVLNVVALWKQETRRPPRGAAPAQHATFRESWDQFIAQAHALRRLIAIGLGVPGALAISRSQTAMAKVLDSLFMSPLVLPALAFGFAALMTFSAVGWAVSTTTLVIGHAAVCVPYVIRTTTAALAQMDPALLESMIDEVPLEGAIAKAQQLMAGQVRGRVVVRIAG